MARVDRLQEATQQLKLRVKRAWLVTEALDYLREVGSSYLPLRVQASAGVIPAVAAAAQHEARSASLRFAVSLNTSPCACKNVLRSGQSTCTLWRFFLSSKSADLHVPNR